MSKGRILIVEDDADISNMLQIYFTGQEYEVDLAARGKDALVKCRKNLPDLIVLDIMLPDIDGYEVCKQLRITTRTSHIPIIFLTMRDARSDKIAGLELGADDYITKPFDIEELRLRVKNSITSYRHKNMTDPSTALPSARLIEDQLRKLMRQKNWALLQITIDHMDAFGNVYGFVAVDEVLRFTANLLSSIADQLGTTNDFIGHASNDTFILITHAHNVNKIKEQMQQQFDEGISAHYSFMDREQGGISLPDNSLAPIMCLSVGIVSDRNQQFSDIREITETAAEQRRQDIR